MIVRPENEFDDLTMHGASFSAAAQTAAIFRRFCQPFHFFPRATATNNIPVKFHSIEKREQSSTNKSFRIFVWNMGKCFTAMFIHTFVYTQQAHRWFNPSKRFTLTIEFHFIILLQSNLSAQPLILQWIKAHIIWVWRHNQQSKSVFTTGLRHRHQLSINITSYRIARPLAVLSLLRSYSRVIESLQNF